MSGHEIDRNKLFLDVFPSLQLDGKLKALMELVTVSKISVNGERTSLRVYIVSPQWIHKKYIYKLEEEIASQIFKKSSMAVKIIEKFELSAQYTPENFYEVYRSSILLELKTYNALLHNIFLNSTVNFHSSSHMSVVLSDTVVSRGKHEELYQILDMYEANRLKIQSFFIEFARDKNKGRTNGWLERYLKERSEEKEREETKEAP